MFKKILSFVLSAIPNESIRLRVIPNSNDPKDINVKEQVKTFLAIEVRLYIAKILTGEIMRKELIEYAKTVYLDTPLDEIREHVENMDEFRYVFSMAQKNGRKTAFGRNRSNAF